MNLKNIEYLRDQLKFTGFGEGFENELSEKIGKQTPEFTLSHQTQFGNDTVEAQLRFQKSAQPTGISSIPTGWACRKKTPPNPCTRPFTSTKQAASP